MDMLNLRLNTTPPNSLSKSAAAATGLGPIQVSPTKVGDALASADKSLGPTSGAKLLNQGLKALSGQTLVHLLRKKVF